MTNVIDQAREYLGVCGRCGRDHRLTDAEARETIALDEALEDTPDLRDAIRSLGHNNLLCPPCVIAHQEETSAERQKTRLESLRRRVYGSGLMVTAAKAQTLLTSDPEIEAKNPALWSTIRRHPLDKNLWIFGTPGTSKTFAARCALNDYLAHGKTAAELSAHRLLDISRSFHPERDMRVYMDPNILLIEDIDKPIWTEDAISCLWRLIDARASQKLRLIITANARPDELRDQWRAKGRQNNSTISSMFERMLPMQRIETTGQSFRREREPGEEG